MTSSYVQVPPDSTGKQVATNELAGKQYQIINVADSSGAEVVMATAALQTSANTKLDTIHADLTAALPAGTNSIGQVTANAGTNLNTSALALESGNLATIASRLPASATTTPTQAATAQPVRQVGEEIITAGFSAVGSSVLDSVFNSPKVGTGVTYSQGSGSLAIVAGTTANAEFLTRSVRSVRGSHRMRFSIIASQRIVNNNLAVMVADLLGENLSYSIVSATVVNVTLTAHGFTSQNVGQFVNIGGITGAAGVPGRYAIASIVDANTIQFTVAGWPASGSGTCSLFGRNYIRHLVTGTTATNINVDAQRNGWATGDTVATINTTASPGTVMMHELTGRDVFFSDALRATATTPNFTTRASRYENIMDSDVDLYVFIWSFNGTTNPATSTTWTLGHLSLETFANLPVYIEGVRANGTQNPLPVNIATPATLPVSLATNTPTLAAGTNLAADVGIQYRASATGGASSLNIFSPATAAGATIKGSAGRLIGYHLTNSSAALRSVKLFNATSVTMGTTSAQFEIDLPAGVMAGIVFEGGLAFTTGIMWAVTSAKGLTDNTSTGLVANDVSGYFVFA